jgi:hypothetical protein
MSPHPFDNHDFYREASPPPVVSRDRFTTRIKGLLKYYKDQAIPEERINNALYLDTITYSGSLSGRCKTHQGESLTKVNQKYAGTTLRVIGFVKYIGCHSVCLVKCAVHGNSSEFGKPWTPELYRMMYESFSCPKCAGRYRYSNEERIVELNEMLAKRGTGISVTELIKIRGQTTRCRMHCNNHGCCNSWGNPWQPTIGDLQKHGCPKCSKCYRYTKQDSILRVQTALDRFHPHLHISGFVKYIGKNSRCRIHCEHHGNGEDWGTPWLPHTQVILRGFGCPKCSKTYRITAEERVILLNKKLASTLWGVLSVNGTGNKARCDMYCKIHGKGCNWGKPWQPTVNDVDSGYGCPKCQGNYRKTAIEAQIHVNQTLTSRGFHHRVIGFFDKYIGKESLCQIHCKKHGYADIWENPWQPRLHDINMKYINCLKCSGEYVLGEIEAKDAINNFISPKKIRVNSFDQFFLNEKVNNSRCIMLCTIHGCGDFHTPQWRPTLGDLKAGTGCPMCGFEGRMLQHCLKHTELFSLPRYLYYLTFKIKTTGERFYKIGVRSKRLLSSRYSLTQMKACGLIIESEWIVLLPNIISLTSEYFILSTYGEYLKYQPLMRQKGIYGATECMTKDISSESSMELIILKALSEITNILHRISKEDINMATLQTHIEQLAEDSSLFLQTLIQKRLE